MQRSQRASLLDSSIDKLSSNEAMIISQTNSDVEAVIVMALTPRGKTSRKLVVLAGSVSDAVNRKMVFASRVV
jgi:hypothetical protein